MADDPVFPVQCNACDSVKEEEDVIHVTGLNLTGEPITLVLCNDCFKKVTGSDLPDELRGSSIEIPFPIPFGGAL